MNLPGSAPWDSRLAGLASFRRTAGLLLLSVVAATEMALAEGLFVGHIVFLIQALGFAGALVAFTALWAALGLTVLAVVDLAWPRMAPRLRPTIERATRRAADVLSAVRMGLLPAGLGIAGALAAAGVAIALWGGDIADWTVDHRVDVGIVIAASLLIFVVVAAIARAGRALTNWVRRIAEKADPLTRAIGALVSMIVLGPALGWLLFRLLRYSRRSVYVLTLVAAPVFAAVWVPFYGLGVWGLVESLL